MGVLDSTKIGKSIYNLCHPKSDIGQNARCVFFATRYCKQPCDVIGGTVKRLLSNNSLKRDVKDQILSLGGMFQFLKGKNQNIIVEFIFKADLNNTTVILNNGGNSKSRHKMIS